MLTVAKVTGIHAIGYADYLEGKATATSAGDYYLKDGERVEAPGRWVTGASAVGVDPARRVDGQQLRSLMDVRRPDTGAPLRPVGSTGEAVAALDATFSAPKSVSAVWAIADQELRAAVEDAHETAIDRTIAYAAAQVPMVRERLDRRTVIHTKPRELVATAWRHTTARAVDGPPDPQLHTHVLLHAAVRRDGQLAAIDSRQWLTHRRELGAAYRTEFARELSELGFAIRRGTGRGARYFELDGIPDALLDQWSSRHHQVQEAIRARLDRRRANLRELIAGEGGEAAEARAELEKLDETEQLSAGEDRFLTHATRAAKQPETRTDLDALWRSTADDIGVTPQALSGLREPDRPPLKPASDTLEARLTEHDATLSRSHARAIALEQSAGVPIRDALVELARMRDTDRLLALTDGTLTTGAHRTREQQTAALAARLAVADVDPIPARLVDQHASRLDTELHDQGGQLSDEQRAALRLACSDGQLIVIEGQAGTGKSTLLTGVARAHEAAGQQIIVTSTAALAAQRLADELTTAGAHPTAYSTTALTRAIDDERVALDPATTVIHDEAALASTHELRQVLNEVEASGARLILVGDPRQSHPVGAGGLWPSIETAARRHNAHAELTRNLRARDPDDARDQHRFRNDKTGAALNGYAERGRVHLRSDHAAAEDAALDAARADERAGRRTLVIAQTSNERLDELNARAQAIRRQEGQLGADSIALTGRPYRLHPGDDIQLRATIQHPEFGTLRNGSTATITVVDPDADTATIALSHDRKATLTREQLDQAQARLAYVQHPFPAQGTTTDTAHLIVAEHPTREGTYVAITRARDQTHIHAGTDRLDQDLPLLTQLAERVSATEPDLPSIAHPLAHEQAVEDRIEHARGGAVAGPLTTARSTRTADETQIDTAAIIETYRRRYGVPDDDPRPLGPEPASHAFGQRLDQRHAAREALQVLSALDGKDADVLRQQLREAAGFAEPASRRGVELET